MKVKELIKRLQECDQNAKIEIIQEETLECLPDIWDDNTREVTGKATNLYEEDLYSHEFYLLAIKS
jgi:hypothetical protein